MNHDDENLEDKRKFSVVQECPKCGHLSLVFRKGRIVCTSCGYNEATPMLR